MAIIEEIQEEEVVGEVMPEEAEENHLAVAIPVAGEIARNVLPQELVHSILARLPVVDRLRLRFLCVCKNFARFLSEERIVSQIRLELRLREEVLYALIEFASEYRRWFILYRNEFIPFRRVRMFPKDSTVVAHANIVYAVGGSGFLNQVLLIDGGRKFTSRLLPHMGNGRERPAVGFHGGRLIVFGGTRVFTLQAEIFDTSTEVWTLVDIQAENHLQTAVIGGFFEYIGPDDDVAEFRRFTFTSMIDSSHMLEGKLIFKDSFSSYMFNPEDRTMLIDPPELTEWVNCDAWCLHGAKLYCFFADVHANFKTRLIIFDATVSQWKPVMITADLPFPVSNNCALTWLYDDLVLIAEPRVRIAGRCELYSFKFTVQERLGEFSAIMLSSQRVFQSTQEEHPTILLRTLVI